LWRGITGRYCDACRAPLVSAVGQAEYKQVTVLFADVARSMDIASAVDGSGCGSDDFALDSGRL
jgi:hypothetical protein